MADGLDGSGRVQRALGRGNGTVGQAVTFDGSGSSDSDGTIVSYGWDFGDGSAGTGSTPTHAYSAAGEYTITLTVTDDDAASDQASAVITIASGGTPGTPIEVFTDSFENGQWNGLWAEDSQNDWRTSRQRATDGSYSAELDGRTSDAELVSVPIDLQGAASASIQFSWYIESGLDLGEYLAFDVSTDAGASWTQRATLQGDIDAENQWHDEQIELTGLATNASLRLRFRGTMNGAAEDANVDAVRITTR